MLVPCDPGIQSVDPTSPFRPRLWMIFLNRFLVQSKREQEVGVHALERRRWSDRHFCRAGVLGCHRGRELKSDSHCKIKLYLRSLPALSMLTKFLKV